MPFGVAHRVRPAPRADLIPSPAVSSAAPRRLRLPFPALLVAAVALAFAPALGAGFLNYDDPWLIQNNPFFGPRAAELPAAALFAFDLDTRLTLGAEYLPVRDLFVWLETRLFGLSPVALHAVSLTLYATATCALYGALGRTLPSERSARAASLLFALAPVHVESVGWLSGQKDVLALLFSCLALLVHARACRRAVLWVPLLFSLASLSKSMSVAVAPLLVVHDLTRGRRLDARLYALLGLLLAGTLLAHLYVGRLVGMAAAFPGGSRLTALYTMGPVILRYLRLAFDPSAGSIVHAVPTLTFPSAASLAGYALCALWLGVALARRSRVGLLGWAWFFIPLAPVCQLLVPLQNRMADRYLLWSVLGPLLLAAALYDAASARLAAGGRRVLGALAICIVAASGLGAFDRAVVFSDSVLLFSDALPKAESAAVVPYQLGCAWEERGDTRRAEEAYAEALRRGLTQPDATLASAANNLATLLFRRGDFGGAQAVLTQALAKLPGHPKMTKNLSKVQAALAL
jgi:Tetratricopeptide repeat